MEKNKNRLGYFDFLRGVAIIFVIICHSYSGNPLAGTVKEDLYLILRQVVTCAVPMFLAMSGYFMVSKDLSNRKDYWDFVFSHSFRIWLPMVIWSLPLFVIKDHNNYLTSLLLLLMGGYSIYYFITLSIQYYAMQPLLKKIELGGVFICLLITLGSVGVENYFIMLKGYNIPMILKCGPFWMWLVYSALGYYIRKKSRCYNLTPCLVLLCVCLIACFFETKLLYCLYQGGDGATKTSAVLFSCCAILVLFNERTQKWMEKDNICYRAIVFVGKISFGIYLIHKYFLDYIVSRIVDDTLARTALTLIMSSVFIYLVERILPQKVSTRLLGFR